MRMTNKGTRMPSATRSINSSPPLIPFIRYSGNKETELRIRIHFWRQFVERKIRFRSCKVSANMYATQLKKIEKAMEKLHPDLQFDFRYQMQGLDTYPS